MNPNETPGMDLPTLLALRKERGLEALRTITDRLRVKDMGPADHIRTKHEVKAFLESGDPQAAAEVLKRAGERLTLWQAETLRISQQQGRRMGQ
jgi:phage-related baseplate assembly protein